MKRVERLAEQWANDPKKMEVARGLDADPLTVSLLACLQQSTFRAAYRQAIEDAAHAATFAESGREVDAIRALPDEEVGG